MIVDTLMEQSGETSRVIDIYEALKTIHGLNVESMSGEIWMDDQYEADYYSVDGQSNHESGMDNLDENDMNPEDETRGDGNWMDDLDEAA